MTFGNEIGKLLIVLGGILAFVGIVIYFGGKIPFIGKLPGDIHFEGKNFDIYIPIATGILISIILSGLISLIQLFLFAFFVTNYDS